MTVLEHQELAVEFVESLGREVFYRPATTDEQVLKDVFYYRYHRPPVTLQPATVLDCGAHIGATMLDYRHLWPDARIFGVEMDAGNAAVAKMNTGDPVLCAAIADIGGGIGTYKSNEEHWAHALNEDGRGWAAMTTINRVAEALGWPRVSFVKLDIEGGEQNILQFPPGLERVDSLLVECHHAYDWRKACRDLRAAGFKTQRHKPHPNAAFAWREP